MVLLDFVENSRAHRSIRSEERWINWTYIQRSCKALSRSFLWACSRWPWVSSYDEEKGIVVIVLHSFLFAGCIFYGKSLWLGSVWLPNETVDTTSWGIKVPYNSENHDSASCLLATCFSSYRNFKLDLGKCWPPPGGSYSSPKFQCSVYNKLLYYLHGVLRSWTARYGSKLIGIIITEEGNWII